MAASAIRPSGAYYGTDAFTYTLADPYTTGAAATVTLTITETPVANPYWTYVFGEGTTLTGNIIADASDYDPLSDPFTAAVTTEPADGALALLSPTATSPTSPTPASNGQDTFAYTLTDASTPACRPPSPSTSTARPSQTTTITSSPRAPTVNGNITLNAGNYDPEGDPFTYTLDGQPHATGNLTLHAQWYFHLYPRFQLPRSRGLLQLHSSRSLYHQRTPGHHLPEARHSARRHQQHLFRRPQQSLTGQNLITDDTGAGVDSDGDGDTLTVYSINHNPTAVGGTVSTSHGTVHVNANGTFTYTPGSHFEGTDSVVYADSDGFTSSNNATVTFDVAGSVIPPPATVPSPPSTIPPTTAPSPPSDPDSDPLTYSLLTGPTHGSVVVHANGTFTYTPTAHLTGTDSFVFSVSDGTLAANATISIAVTDNAPVAVDDPGSTLYTIGHGQTLLVSNPVNATLSNDLDADSDPLNVYSFAGR